MYPIYSIIVMYPIYSIIHKKCMFICSLPITPGAIPFLPSPWIPETYKFGLTIISRYLRKTVKYCSKMLWLYLLTVTNFAELDLVVHVTWFVCLDVYHYPGRMSLLAVQAGYKSLMTVIYGIQFP